MTKSKAETLADLPQAQRVALLSTYTAAELTAMWESWEFWARSNQLPPPEPWTYWLVMAGRGFGKTRVGTETVRRWVKDYSIVNLIGATVDDARDIMIEGESGILAKCPPAERPEYVKSARKLVWPNGATSLIFTADEPERLRGKQHMKLWCLAGDTGVLMADGSSKRIDAVREGDFVATRSGSKVVTAQALTKQKTEVFCVKTLGGQAIIGTADHPVWIDGFGFKTIDSIVPGDKACVTSALSGAARSGTDTTEATTPRWSDCIGRYGSLPMGQSRKASTSTTSTGIRETIGSKISNCSHIQSTVPSTGTRSLHYIARLLLRMLLRRGCGIARSGTNESSNVSCVRASTTAGRKPRVGSVRWRVSTFLDRARSVASGACVSFALLRTKPKSECSGSAHGSVTRWRASNGNPQRSKSRARSVASHSQASGSTLDSALGRAPWLSTATIVSVERLEGLIDVYDITVDGAREFFANGILVHNCDELGAWRYPESWDQAQLGLRLGNNPQAVVTTTPRPVEMVKSLLAHPACVTTRGTTYDNRRNLAPAFYDTIIRKYEGTRLGRQELMAELLTDVPGALWTHKIIDAGRISLMDVRWDCVIRVVVAIDPAVTSNPDSDETGIVVGALTLSMHVLILDDVSCQETPLGWARAAILAYRRHKADRIVAEVNNGGDLVEGNIRGVDASVPYRAVRASRGKAIRAEPVAALYEQGRVHHVGSFPELEQQMCEWTPIGDAKSPDRLDALCWCVFDLLLDTEEIVMQTPLVQPYRIL